MFRKKRARPPLWSLRRECPASASGAPTLEVGDLVLHLGPRSASALLGGDEKGLGELLAALVRASGEPSPAVGGAPAPFAARAARAAAGAEAGTPPGRSAPPA